MIDAWIVRLREPRIGVVVATAVLALLMAAHWRPMAVPGALVLSLAVLRPDVAVRPTTWWAMGVLWWTALVVAQHRMEDHVHLFAAWLVALAVALALAPAGDETPAHLTTPTDDEVPTDDQVPTDDRAPTHDQADDEAPGSDRDPPRRDRAFIEQAAWQARVLIGVTFTAAVAWKLWFSQFVTGTTLWVFLLVDGRFRPLARVVGLSDDAIVRGRADLRDLIAGTVDVVALDAPASVAWRITAVAILTLVVEAVVAVSHLVGDGHRLARLRLPSIVVFAVTTYVVVPVFLFAMLLAVLELTTAHWRREAMWIVPVIVVVSIVRFAFVTMLA